MTKTGIDSSLTASISELLDKGAFREASERCLEGLSVAPDSPHLKYLLALADEGLGDIDAAKRQFVALAGAHPDHADVRYQLGRLSLMEGAEASARECFESCLANDPNHAAAYTALARMDYASGEIKQAETRLRSALRANPEHVPALATLALVCIDQDLKDEANNYASQAVQLAPEDPAAQLAMGQVMLARGYIDFARQCLENAVVNDPENPRVYLAFASLLQRQGQHHQALQALGAAEARGMTGSVLNRARVQSLVNLGRFMEAQKLCFEMLDQHGPEASVMMALGDIHFTLGDEPGLSALIERLPASGLGLRAWFHALGALVERDRPAALEWLGQALSEADAALVLRIRMLRAELYLAESQPSAVIAELDMVAQSANTDHNLSWQIARLARSSGDYGFAISVLKALKEAGETDEDARVRTEAMLVDLHDLNEDFDEAVAGFHQAAWQPPYFGETADPSGTEVIELDRLSPWPWSSQPAAESPPIFLTGWPFSGRDLIFAGLTWAGLKALPVDDWPSRREKLQLPATVDELSRLDDVALRLMRRRYLRSPFGQTNLIESGPIFARDLSMIARVFPEAIVVVAKVEQPYLDLQWRLAGFRQVPTMRKLWAHEQSLLDQVRPLVPLRFIEVDLSQLLTDPEKTMASLCVELGLSWQPRLTESLRNLIRDRGYRPPEHWRRYSRPIV